MKKQTKKQKREKRHLRVRANVFGTADRPRMHVSRSLRGMYIQLIDDTIGSTLVSVNSKKDCGSGDAGGRKGKEAVSYLLGRALAEKAKTMKITKIVFDRAGHKYHGRVKAAAEGARDAGLEF